MNTISNSMVLIACYLIPIVAIGSEQNNADFNFKEVDDFPYLSETSDASSFQALIDKYVEDCIDSSEINTKTRWCFIGYKLWERELNKYYQLLLENIHKENVGLLTETQAQWAKNLEKTTELNSAILDIRYGKVQGTMFDAMRSGEADSAITPLVKQRALLLRSWYNTIEKGSF